MLLIRLVLSLVFLAALLGLVYKYMKKHGIGAGSGLIEVLDRKPLTRASSVHIIRVADQVLVVGSNENNQLTLLGDLDPDVVEHMQAQIEAEMAEADATAAQRRETGFDASNMNLFDPKGWVALVQTVRERTVRKA